jgi:hypothetical protein
LIDCQTVKYWEIIADNLHKAGWSWGCVSAIDSEGRTIWIADAHRDDGKRFVVHADEKLTAFIELELAIRACGRIVLTGCRGFSKLGVAKRIRIRRRLSPARFFAPSGPAILENQLSGEKEEKGKEP